MTSEECEIVIVEDDPNDAELIRRVLKKHNLANCLTHLKDGAEAIEFLFGEGAYQHRKGSSPPRVVLLDLKLPKMSGIDVLRKFKSDDRTRKIPVVILTSSREDQDLKAAYELGVNSFVTKPIRFDEFAKVVSELGLYWMLVNRSTPG